MSVAPEGMADIARWGALTAGSPDSVPAVTVNRFCVSSPTGAINIAHAIRSNELGIGLAAEVESMSRSGLARMKDDAPFGPSGPIFLLDTMWGGAGGPPNPVLVARNAYVEMIKMAQNVSDRYELTREEIDAFALRSHQHAAAARDSESGPTEEVPVDGKKLSPKSWNLRRPGHGLCDGSSVLTTIPAVRTTLCSARSAIECSPTTRTRACETLCKRYSLVRLPNSNLKSQLARSEGLEPPTF